MLDLLFGKQLEETNGIFFFYKKPRFKTYGVNIGAQILVCSGEKCKKLFFFVHISYKKKKNEVVMRYSSKTDSILKSYFKI